MTDIQRLENDGQLKEIAELAEKIWHECFTEIISEEQICYMVEKFQSYNAMREQTENQDYYYLGVYENGVLCGYIGLKPEHDSRMFLSKLYLEKGSRGKGTASEMLGRVFDEARKNGKKSVYLTVNKDNLHAIEVYTRKGFEIIDSVVTDIGGGFVMDDYIMQYRL
ncbi:MAG: GNAT family N-acetyltransferase [Ruminococcus sp.]|nr:GNAT family N-acetyltransferase [Ruminococcus sp.]